MTELSSISETPGNYVLVPEYLPRDIKLHDQPPFTWLRLNVQIFPVGFFKNEDDFPVFLRAVALHSNWTPEKGKPSILVTDALHAVSDEYNQSAIFAAQKARDYLNSYPYAIRYLKEKWAQQNIYLNDGSKNPKTKMRDRTYAAYAWDLEQRRLSGIRARDLEISETAPGFATSQQIIDAVDNSGKGFVNRFFRLTRQSEAL